jgi:TolA-binding protein
MMRAHRAMCVVGAAVLAACSSAPPKRTLATLHNVQPDLQDVKVDDGLDTAMQSYQRFLEETPETKRTPEAMRRLADLKIEKEYGLNGTGEMLELPAPQTAAEVGLKPDLQPAAHGCANGAGAGCAGAANQPADVASAVGRASARQSVDIGATAIGTEAELEARATQEHRVASVQDMLQGQLPEGVKDDLERAGPLEAIKLYDRLLEKYPSHEHNDQVLYQKARAYDELGRTVEAMQVMEQLTAAYPRSKYLDEVHFRRAEHFFTRRKYRDAEGSYEAIIKMGPVSEYYELALYKLGWSLYKQEMYEEALHRYVALLDYKVSIGYDFDAPHDEGDERRIADTFDIISLSFSNEGGPEAVQQYFGANGKRSYEDRVYRNLGEYYLTKLRYHDAAKSYNTFTAQYPLHRRSPHFSMRVIEIYETGRFPQLVLDSKKAFASTGPGSPRRCHR